MKVFLKQIFTSMIGGVLAALPIAVYEAIAIFPVAKDLLLRQGGVFSFILFFLSLFMTLGFIFGGFFGLIGFSVGWFLDSRTPLLDVKKRLLSSPGDGDDQELFHRRRIGGLIFLIVFTLAITASMYGTNYYFLAVADFQNKRLAALILALIAVLLFISLPLVLSPVWVLFDLLFRKLRQSFLFVGNVRISHIVYPLIGIILMGGIATFILGWSTIEKTNYKPILLTLIYFILGGGVVFLRNKWTQFIPARSWMPVILVFILGLLALLHWGENQDFRYLSLKRAILPRYVMGALKQASDFDGDGFSAFFGGGDCAPFNNKVYPDTLEIPGNGIDDNCIGGDLARTDVMKPGPFYDLPADWDGKYNVVFISMDAVRADHVSLYGYERKTTPILDDYAKKKNAYVFENAYTNIPATRWALPLILSSRFPTHILWNTHTFPHTVKKGNTLFPEILHKSGYHTAAQFTIDKKTWGLDQGIIDFRMRNVKNKDGGENVATWARRFLDDNKDGRFFVWLHFYEPHSPYDNHDKIVNFGNRPIDRYDEEIRYTDKQIGRVFDRMDELNLWQNTIVVVTSDHGEGFYEHGHRYHSYWLYEESIKVPMMWFLPGKSGHEIDSLVSHIDFAPTLMNLLEQRSKFEKFLGRSYAQLFFKETQDLFKESPVFASTSFTADYPPSSIRKIITNNYSLFYNVKEQVYELYDLKNDPGEKSNIFTYDHPAVLELLPILNKKSDQLKPNRTLK